jgi:hypothetical protein
MLKMFLTVVFILGTFTAAFPRPASDDTRMVSSGFSSSFKIPVGGEDRENDDADNEDDEYDYDSDEEGYTFE